jgi:predicted molibdopterin-dependent oxidoreductase YjgC
VTAEVLNGVWIGQEPSWDSPINRGSHCAKGASVRELVHSDRRLRYPMKLVNGQWTRTSWETAINETGDKLMQIREKSGAESVYWLGSAKMTNEGSYWFRKFGIERIEGNAEPEDQAAMLCEIMSGLIDGRFGASIGADQQVFEKHVAPWMGRFFADLERAEAARFYRAVGTVGRLLIEIETEAFALS